MPTLSLTVTGLRTTADVARFLEIADSIGISGARSHPLLDSPDGLSVSVSVDVSQIRLPYDERG